MESEKRHPELKGRQYYKDCECKDCTKLHFSTWQWKMIDKILDTKAKIKGLWIFLMPNRYKVPRSLFCCDCNMDVGFGEYNQCAAPPVLREHCKNLKIAYCEFIHAAMKLRAANNQASKSAPFPLNMYGHITVPQEEIEALKIKVQTRLDYLDSEHWKGKPII